jgi:hypothetical protein
MSYACSEGMLDLSRPHTADAGALNRSLLNLKQRDRTVLRQCGRNNTSSFAGAGAIVTAEVRLPCVGMGGRRHARCSHVARLLCARTL